MPSATPAPARRPARPASRVGETYNASQLVNAYLQGVQRGEQNVMAVLVEKLRENVQIAGEAAAAIGEAVRAAEVGCEEIYLRIEDVTRIDAMLVVDEESFLAEAFDDAYRIARERRDAVSSPTMELDVSFAPDIPDLDRTALTADGFFRFQPETEAA